MELCGGSRHRNHGRHYTIVGEKSSVNTKARQRRALAGFEIWGVQHPARRGDGLNAGAVSGRRQYVGNVTLLRNSARKNLQRPWDFPLQADAAGIPFVPLERLWPRRTERVMGRRKYPYSKHLTALTTCPSVQTVSPVPAISGTDQDMAVCNNAVTLATQALERLRFWERRTSAAFPSG